MADKLIGYGTIVKIGSTAVGEIRSVTPPPRAYERIAVDDLDSEIRVEMQGIEDVSEWSFTELWDPPDTNHTLIDTDFDNRANSSWSIVYPGVNPGDGDGRTATQTWTFNARVVNIEPAELTNADVVTRTVTLTRTGDITKT